MNSHSILYVCFVLGFVLDTLNYNYLRSSQQSLDVITSVIKSIWDSET